MCLWPKKVTWSHSEAAMKRRRFWGRRGRCWGRAGAWRPAVGSWTARRAMGRPPPTRRWPWRRWTWASGCGTESMQSERQEAVKTLQQELFAWVQGWLSPSRCQHKAGQWPLSFWMHAQTLTDSVGIKKVFGKWNWNCLWGRFQWHHHDAVSGRTEQEWKNAFTGLSQTEPKYSTVWSRSAKMTKPMQGIITAAVIDYDWYLGFTESDRFQIDNHNNLRQSWENQYWAILDIS